MKAEEEQSCEVQIDVASETSPKKLGSIVQRTLKTGKNVKTVVEHVNDVKSPLYYEKTQEERKKEKLKKCSQISQADAMAAINSRQQIRRSYLSLPLPVIFFILFAMCIMDHNPPRSLFLMNNSLKNVIVSSGTDGINTDTTMKYQNIATISDVFDWLTGTLLPSVFVTTDYNGNALDDRHFGRIALFNRLLGAVELLITNAKTDECKAHKILDNIYPQCSDYNVLDVKSMYLDADLNSTEAVRLVNLAKATGKFLSERTTSLEVTVPTYNGELRIFGVTKLYLEFERGGFIKLKSTISSIPADPYEHSRSYVYDILFLACFIVMSSLEIKEMLQNIKNKSFRHYIGDFWNIIDLLAIISILITYFVWLGIFHSVYDQNFTIHLSQLTGKGNDLQNNNDARKRLADVVLRLKNMANSTTVFRFAAMVSCILLALRVLKHLRFQPRLAILSNTVAKSINDFGPFIFVFMVSYSAFVVSGCLLFGEIVVGFSSFGRSAITCVNILFGNFDFESIVVVDYTTAVIFYWGYMVVIFLILLNMMLAIVLDAYAEVKSSNLRNERSILKEVHSILFEDLSIKNLNSNNLSMENLKSELSSGKLKDCGILTCEKLMNAFNVSEKVAMKAILSLKNDAPLDNNDTNPSSCKFDSLSNDVDALERKINLLLNTVITE